MSVVIVGVAAGIFGFRLGTGNAEVNWTTGTAYSAEGAISARADGQSYDIPLTVQWTDPLGSVHQGTRPACLPPDAKTHKVTFAWVWVKTDQEGWRDVVWVRC